MEVSRDIYSQSFLEWLPPLPEVGTLAMSVRADMGRQGPGGVRAWQSLRNMLENLLKIGECVFLGCTAPSLCGQRDKPSLIVVGGQLPYSHT